MTATTAELREKARDCEKRLEWEEAAAAWDAAVNVYPLRASPGSLAAADVAGMRQRAKNCRATAARLTTIED